MSVVQSLICRPLSEDNISLHNVIDLLHFFAFVNASSSWGLILFLLSSKRISFNKENLDYMLRQALYLMMFFTSGCALYSPQVSPPILVENAGEYQVGLGMNAPVLGVHVDAAVAVTDHIALQGGVSTDSNKNTLFNGSIGIAKNEGQQGRIGLFAGFSAGSGTIQRTSDFDPNYEINGCSHLLYLKPQLTFHAYELDFVLSSKFGKIRQQYFYNETQGQIDQTWNKYQPENEVQLAHLFFEPSFSISMGSDKFRVVSTCSYIKVLKPSALTPGLVSPFNLGMSVFYLKKRK